MKSYIFLLISGVIVMQSCSVQDDEAPAIKSVLVNGIAEDHPHAVAGAAVTFEIEVTDDSDLGQVKLTLSPSDHSHSDNTGEVALLGCPTVGEWEILKIENLDGTDDKMNFTVVVPDTLQGSWDMEIEVADKSGNLSDLSLPLHIQNDFMPFIGADAIIPAPEDEMVLLSPGETFLIEGDVVDSDDLALIDFTIWHEDTVYWNTQVMPMTWTFPLDDVVFPAMTDPGHFELVITASDMEGWTYYKWLEIHVE